MCQGFFSVEDRSPQNKNVIQALKIEACLDKS